MTHFATRWAFVLLALLSFSCSSLKVNEDVFPNFGDGYFYAQLADAAYLDLPELETKLYELGLALETSNKLVTERVQYFLARDKNSGLQIVVIRGTDSIEDAIVDARFAFVDDEVLEIRAHAGFDQAARRIADELFHKLVRDANIAIAGHSLGGAVSVLLGLHLKKAGLGVERIITFGQPKVMDRTAAVKYASLPVLRYTREKDIVPLVPPLSADHEHDWHIYWHVGDEILLHPQDNSYSRLGADLSVLRGVTSYYDDLIKARKLDAHSMSGYLVELEKRRHSSRLKELLDPE
ncbi:MAG: lipase family protein [Gammaproteobacteria bacterium]|nr:lipase family protein [Gammaproteobacteria bacterium]